MSETVLEVAVIHELQEALGGDVAVIKELVAEFIVDATALVDSAMKSAIDDAETFRRAVHSLKTTSATFGATQLSAICQQLERGAREGRPVVVEELDALVIAGREATAELRALFPAD